MKKLLLSSFLVLSALTISGCAQEKQINYNQKSSMLSLGMDKDQVRTVLGDPRRTEVNTERERWVYWGKVYYGFTPVDNEQLSQDRLVVTFQDGKVTKWGQQTLSDDALEMSQKTIEATTNAIKASQ